jgi:ParB-like chromosome segregation protein Spo0J
MIKRRTVHREPAGLATRMLIVHRAIDALTPDPNNPRCHSRKQIRQIAESIRIFGFNVPILIDREGKVIAGHGRLLACRALAITEVPTLCLDHLTQAQARAFMIADNRLTEIASWDDQLLAQQLKDLSLSGLDFSLEITGFEMGEIDLRIASLEDIPAADADPADVLPDPPAGPPVSEIGDLWLLGHHRVLCGQRSRSRGLHGSDGRGTRHGGLPLTRHTMWRSTAMRAAWARSTIARFRWPRAR